MNLIFFVGRTMVSKLNFWKMDMNSEDHTKPRILTLKKPSKRSTKNYHRLWQSCAKREGSTVGCNQTFKDTELKCKDWQLCSSKARTRS